MATLAGISNNQKPVLDGRARQLLLIVALYNLFISIVLLAIPNAFFKWSGVDGLANPGMWQQVGWIGLGLGIGYLLTLWKPKIFWPLGVVGLVSSTAGAVLILMMYFAPFGIWGLIERGFARLKRG